MIRVEHLCKTYRQANQVVHALTDISLSVEAGEFVSLMGASGAGKSTLLQVLGALDRPTSGSYFLDGELVSGLTDDQLALIRNRKIGFIFQSSHFVDYLDLSSNVALPGFYSQILSQPDRIDRANELLGRVGLDDRVSHLPAALSGGERQRAAIARALFNEPSVILADEPTGNLDQENTARVMEILSALHLSGITILLVTHDQEVAGKAGKIWELAQGGGSIRTHE